MRSATPTEGRDAVADFCASLLIPGFGQWLQGRRTPGVYFFLEASTLVAVALAAPSYGSASWIVAGVVTLWSALDAARVARQDRREAA